MVNDPHNYSLNIRPYRIGQGWQVNATYRPQAIPDYRNNPLIEALPPILSRKRAAKLLGRFPVYEESHRQTPDEDRFHLIQSGLKIFTPLPLHTDLERRFSCLIRGGYASRNPLGFNNWPDIDSALEAMAKGEFLQNQTWSTAAGLNMIGMSGMGKSTTTELILNTYPQVIHHSNYKGRNFTHSQVVWLKLECPYDGSPKSICINFFQDLDKVLGTHFSTDFGKDYRTAKVMLPDMANIAAQQYLGLLVVDEIQRLSHARSGGAAVLLDFFGELINRIGVPVIFIGTNKARAILTREVRQIRRGTGQGDVIWNPMEEDQVWKHFVESLWKYQYTRNICPLDSKLCHTLYEECQGITDFAVKIYMLAQIRAITSKEESVTQDIIQSVAKDNLQTAAPFLKALRKRDLRVLSQYEDIPSIDFEEIVRQEISGRSSIGSKYQPQSYTKENNGTASTSQMANASPEADRSKDQGALKAQSNLKSNNHNIKRRKASRTTHKGELCRIVAELETKQGLSAYEALLKGGYIRPSSEYLDS
jgi:hypothetical protein